jgi:hypothetical protein
MPTVNDSDHWRKRAAGRATDLFELPNFVIADQLTQGRFVQFCEHIAQFCVLGTGRGAEPRP